MSLRTSYDFADLMKTVFPTLQWVSGKWFIDGRFTSEAEVTRLIVTTPQLRNKLTKSITPQKGESAFIDTYGDFEGRWLSLPLSVKASQMGACPDCPPCFQFISDPRKILIINRLIFHPHSNNKMIIICGGGGTGKSTFLNVIDQCFEGDSSHTDLTSLLSDSTIMATALESRLILSDELRGDEVTNPAIKQIINQQKIVVRKVYDGARTINSQSQLIFATNKAPRFDITDSGMMRRILFFKMDKKIGKPEIGLDKKRFTDDEIVGLLRYALCYDDQDVMNNYMKGKSWEDFFEADTKEFVKSCCHVSQFRKAENTILKNDYYTYSRWAKDHGYRPYNYSNFIDVNAVLEEWEDEENVSLQSLAESK